MTYKHFFHKPYQKDSEYIVIMQQSLPPNYYSPGSQEPSVRAILPSDNTRGKHFYLWIGKHFKHLISDAADAAATDDGNKNNSEDPCRQQRILRKELKNYQKFAAEYMDFSRGLFVYHGVGTGKTITAITIIDNVLKQSNETVIIVLLPASLRDNVWINLLKEWMKSESQSNIHFVSHNSSRSDEDFFKVIKSVDSRSPHLYIIDESHNFIHNVYTNMQKLGGSKALDIYKYIKNHKGQTKVLCLSASPIKSEPFELALLFNLLRDKSLPEKESVFNVEFINSNDNVLYPDKKRLFQRRILGLVSHYKSSIDPRTYAKQTDHHLSVPMSRYQDDVYSYFEKLEKKAGSQHSAYHTLTRQAANFAFPENAIKRPRPNMMDEDQPGEGNNDDTKTDRTSLYESDRTSLYEKACSAVVKSAGAFFNNAGKPQDLQKDFEVFSKKFKGDFTAYLKGTTPQTRSKLFGSLYSSSAKMTAALFLLCDSPGKSVFYSNFVNMEGLEVFHLYLKAMGISEKEYVEFHGGIKTTQRTANLKTFNDVKSSVRIMMLSSAGAEGISLANVRRVIILEPNWDEDTVTQIVGRAIRHCSHRDLPVNERIVDVFHLQAVRHKDGVTTIDGTISESAKDKQILKKSFLEAIETAAVDCFIFNKNRKDCFQFPQDQVLSTKPGPAYMKNFVDDVIREQNDKVRTEARRVKVVYVKFDEETQPVKCLLDETTGILYDEVFEYPWGRVKMDTSNEAILIGKNTYLGACRVNT